MVQKDRTSKQSHGATIPVLGVEIPVWPEPLNLVHVGFFISMSLVITFKLVRLNLCHRPSTTGSSTISVPLVSVRLYEENLVIVENFPFLFFQRIFNKFLLTHYVCCHTSCPPRLEIPKKSCTTRICDFACWDVYRGVPNIRFKRTMVLCRSSNHGWK